MQWSGLQGIVHGLEHLFHYLDDFLLISPVAEGAAQHEGLLVVLDKLGLPMAVEKLEGLSHIVTFVGIMVDTATLNGEWLEWKSCRKRKVQLLVGKLQHACRWLILVDHVDF